MESEYKTITLILSVMAGAMLTIVFGVAVANGSRPNNAALPTPSNTVAHIAWNSLDVGSDCTSSSYCKGSLVCTFGKCANFVPDPSEIKQSKEDMFDTCMSKTDGYVAHLCWGWKGAWMPADVHSCDACKDGCDDTSPGWSQCWRKCGASPACKEVYLYHSETECKRNNCRQVKSWDAM